MILLLFFLCCRKCLTKWTKTRMDCFSWRSFSTQWFPMSLSVDQMTHSATWPVLFWTTDSEQEEHDQMWTFDTSQWNDLKLLGIYIHDANKKNAKTEAGKSFRGESCWKLHELLRNNFAGSQGPTDNWTDQHHKVTESRTLQRYRNLGRRSDDALFPLHKNLPTMRWFLCVYSVKERVYGYLDAWSGLRFFRFIGDLVEWEWGEAKKEMRKGQYQKIGN